MKFDANLAWSQASSAISANRDVVLALAGVFFLLPSLAVGLLLPAPQFTEGMTQTQMTEVLRSYFLGAFPYVLPLTLFQALGTMSVLILLGDRARPTVGEAIKRGARALVSYILANLMLGLAFGLIAGVIVGIGAATGSAAVIALGLALILLAAIYVMVRCCLVGPSIALEQIHNPVAAIERSLRLTRGNALRIFAFLVLFMVAAGLIGIVVSLVIGLPATLLAGPEAAEIAKAVASAIVDSVIALYFVAVTVAIYRQLADATPEREAQTFD